MRSMFQLAALCSVALVVPAGIASSGCGQGHACTSAGCLDVVLRIDLPAEMAPGSWSFDIEADGRTWHCAFDLPAAGNVHDVCSGDDDTVRVWVPNESLESGAYFDFTRTVSNVEVVARHDGEEVATRTVSPKYKTTYPNGPDCEPACQFAEVKLELEE